MTRKRFVKLLMAKGYDRNEANDAAADARKSGIEYSTACTVHCQLADIDISAFCNAVRNIADSAVKVAQAIANAAAAFAKAFRETMEETHVARGEWGKTVFATCEEAQAAIARNANG